MTHDHLHVHMNGILHAHLHPHAGKVHAAGVKVLHKHTHKSAPGAVVMAKPLKPLRPTVPRVHIKR